MPRRGSQIAPNSFWQQAEAQIFEAELASYKGGESTVWLTDDPSFDRLIVRGIPGAFTYKAYFRDPNDWPANGRTEKSKTRHDAIDLIAERIEVAANRELIKDETIRGATPEQVAKMDYLGGRYSNEAPLPGGRSF